MRSLSTTRFSATALLIGAAVLSGCNTNDPVDQELPAETAAAPEEVPAEVAAAREELPEADRQLVAAQKVCPVSGKSLGAMGKPIKVTVDGRDVFICCEGCEEPLKSEPQKHLATLDSQGD